MTVVFLPQAEEDLRAAARYYDQQSPELGTRFRQEVQRTVHAVSRAPHAAPSPTEFDAEYSNAFRLVSSIPSSQPSLSSSR
ncbi:type II toxin-antitoxin system RelE/ParE family toxin [Nitrospira sp. Nam74]